VSRVTERCSTGSRLQLIHTRSKTRIRPAASSTANTMNPKSPMSRRCLRPVVAALRSARQHRPEVPGRRRPRSPGSVRAAGAGAGPRLQTRPGPQHRGNASGPAGTRETRLRAHRGADPRLADPVRRGSSGMRFIMSPGRRAVIAVFRQFRIDGAQGAPVRHDRHEGCQRSGLGWLT
jgi:hypothetical protein